jgi:type II secretory pathway pseudopilin PulG
LTQPRRQPRIRRAVALLEVVLAISIVVIAAAVIQGSYVATTAATARMQQQVRAENLAATILARVRLGLIDPVAAGPNDFESLYPDRAGWTWQIEVATEPLDTDGPEATRVEVLVTSPDARVRQRLAQWFLPAVSQPAQAIEVVE